MSLMKNLGEPLGRRLIDGRHDDAIAVGVLQMGINSRS